MGHASNAYDAMLVAYEVSIRMGIAIIYYQYAHSSGTFGSVGIAVGVGKLLDFSVEQMNHALSVSKFNAPLVPDFAALNTPR